MRASLPGAEKKCIDPHAKTPDTGVIPHESFDPKKYPFLSIEFPFEEPDHVVTDHAEAHYYAKPEECEPCKDLKDKVSDLEETVEELQRKAAARASGSLTYPTTSRYRYNRRYR